MRSKTPADKLKALGQGAEDVVLYLGAENSEPNNQSTVMPRPQGSPPSSDPRSPASDAGSLDSDEEGTIVVKKTKHPSSWAGVLAKAGLHAAPTHRLAAVAEAFGSDSDSDEELATLAAAKPEPVHGGAGRSSTPIHFDESLFATRMEASTAATLEVAHQFFNNAAAKHEEAVAALKQTLPKKASRPMRESPPVILPAQLLADKIVFRDKCYILSNPKGAESELSVFTAFGLFSVKKFKGMTKYQALINFCEDEDSSFPLFLNPELKDKLNKAAYFSLSNNQLTVTAEKIKVTSFYQLLREAVDEAYCSESPRTKKLRHTYEVLMSSLSSLEKAAYAYLKFFAQQTKSPQLVAKEAKRTAWVAQMKMGR